MKINSKESSSHQDWKLKKMENQELEITIEKTVSLRLGAEIESLLQEFKNSRDLVEQKISRFLMKNAFRMAINSLGIDGAIIIIGAALRIGIENWERAQNDPK